MVRRDRPGLVLVQLFSDERGPLAAVRHNTHLAQPIQEGTVIVSRTELADGKYHTDVLFAWR